MTNTATLINAIKSGSDDAVVEILRNNPQAASGKGPAGESPVLLARYFGKPALAGQIAMLTETDLCESAALGLTARLRTLLELGTNLEERSFDGWTPLHLAAFFGHADAAALLLEFDADLESISLNSTANTPLCAALAGSADIAFIKLLVDRGANINVEVENGLRPLHLAASRGDVAVIQLLLDAGANAQVTMHDGVTPAAMAQARGHEPAAALLS